MMGTNNAMTEHRKQAQLENIDFLLSVGMHPDRVARRVGLSRATMDRMLERRNAGGAGDTGNVETAGDGS